MANKLEELRARLAHSEAALEWLHTNIKHYFASVPVGDMDECILHAGEALKPYITDRVVEERDLAVASHKDMGGTTMYFSDDE